MPQDKLIEREIAGDISEVMVAIIEGVQHMLLTGNELPTVEHSLKVGRLVRKLRARSQSTPRYSEE